MPKSAALIALVLVLVLVGCGGSGPGSSSGSPTLTKSRLRKLLSQGVLGIGDLHQGGGGTGRGVRQVRPLVPPALRKKTASRAAGRGADPPFFDESVGLWASEFMEGDPQGAHTWGRRFYEDEATTKPAGGDVWESHWEASPVTDDEDFSVTAGPRKGWWYKDHEVSNGDGSGSSAGNGFDPESGGFAWTQTWDETGLATTTERFTRLDGSWIQYQGGATQESGSAFVLSTSEGIEIALSFTPMGAGSGTMKGPSPLLPATLAWGDDQVGTITWADGSTSSFDDWGF